MADFGILLRNEYVISLAILLGFILGAKFFLFIFKRYLIKLASKTKTHIDDIILEILTKPLYTLVIFIGIFFSFKRLPLLSSYQLWVDRTSFVVIVLIFSYVISKILSILIEHWLKVHRRFEKIPKLINKVVTVTIYVIAILMILSYFEVEINPLIATLGLGGLAIGLALQNTLTNFFAGLHIITDKPIKVGDFIEIEDGKVSGYVEDIGWRSTRLKTLPNTIIIIPNSKLAESIIVNDSMPEQEIAVIVQCGVAYGSDLDLVEKVTIEVGREIQKNIPGAIKTFDPFIRYHTFADSNINFSVILRVERFVDKYPVVHEFIKALKKRYDKEGIEISWPVRKIYQAKSK